MYGNTGPEAEFPQLLVVHVIRVATFHCGKRKDETSHPTLPPKKSLYFCLTKNITAIVIFALHKHHFFFAPSCCIFPTLERHNLSRMVDEACGLGCNRLDKGIFADVRELLATDTAVVAHLAHQLASIIQKQ
ncbi:hypothetical protein PV326_007733 [Microctonus aethiopoides]|nr:hypothetical protein PV326_007733 [Microctonus aethiopoides]